MMSLADFCRHLTKHGCKYKPLEGANITGNAIEITNPANHRYYILTIYNGGMISDTTIKEICLIRLFIPTP